MENVMTAMITALIVAVIALIGGQTSPASGQESALAEVKKLGQVIAGVKNDYPPAGYINQNGEWVGFDVDIANYIANKLGVKLQMEAVTSRTRIPMLVNGNIDLIININPTRERAQTVDFTQAYFLAGTTLLVHKDSGIRGIEDLVPPLKVGSVQGSADAPGLLAQQPKADIQYFQEFPQVFLALKQKRIDAMLTASVTLAQMSKGDPDLVVIMPPFKPDPWAIAVRHNDSKWRLALEEILMDAWIDGTIARLHQEHIGMPVNFRIAVWPDYYQK
jgi:polar amino acid transport system substrate-binding protein